ncbi:cytochrome C [Citrobacter amalonaticus]|uniref:Cytochrome c-type protein n=2 Tax=Citrobacter amalonaticus TaxID=35703 RepID=A0A2S4RYJ2_CITAM|nr:cytochrome C [Citrobacter amalonaticus]POT76807.1 cytochrome C [Citrobacter amalonaticus]POU65886.1 cytochrome C [Citrobacter amalonaticus]POV06043.1 cytochrome C [Citrobacter amalonaticus]
MKKIIILTVLLSAVVGALVVFAAQWTLHKTSSTEFCLSCHTMQAPYEEYLGSRHFQNQKGIRAECADCHIPEGGMGYLVAKIKASKDLWHQFITKKIDTPEQFEEHRLDMAQTVWDQLKANDSATCRSCHSMDAMDLEAQTADARKMHEMGVKEQQTCIDCHKGVAHFPPEIKMDDSALKGLEAQAVSTPASATELYVVGPGALGDLATLYPATQLNVLKTTGTTRLVEIRGSQMQGSEQVIYYAAGQRLVLASLSEKGQQALNVLSDWKTDEYGNVWRDVALQGEWSASALASREPMWDYARKLDNVYCAGCHAPIPAKHFTLNAWPSVAKGMGARTNISENELDILSRYFQYNAKDIHQ